MASPYSPTRQILSRLIRPSRIARFATRSHLDIQGRVSRRTAATSSVRNPAISKLTASFNLPRLRAVLVGSVISTSLYAVYLYVTDTRASLHRYVIPPLMQLLYADAEDSHHAGTAALKTLYALGLHPRERSVSSNCETELWITVFDTELPNPIGISAGLDKDAEIPDALFALGASVVEVGGCTPFPQEGNPKPRVFRIPSLEGMVNRYGLNSSGADAMAARLRSRMRSAARSLGFTEEEILDGIAGAPPPGSLAPGRLLLVQIAKNKATDERDVSAVMRDYVYCVERLAPYADVLVVNVSSPNTPGLRDLQATEPLTRILTAVVDEAKKSTRRCPPKVMVKVSPDEDDDSQMEGVVQAVWASGVDGVIVGNTTKRRSGLIPPGLSMTSKEEKVLMKDGGFSGPAMFGRTLDLVKRYRKMLDSYSLEAPKYTPSGFDAEHDAKHDASSRGSKQKVIFATGGITNGKQAVKVLNAGASIAMVYTGLVYGGSGTITRMKEEIKKELPSKEA